ncbi:MAG: hypothetical protein ABIR11_13340 [Candidatus Limnocylindrales bacterium]
MPEANRLTAPGEPAAIARVEAMFRVIDQLGPADLARVPIPRLDIEDREIRLAELERLADHAGRGRLLDDARDALTSALVGRFGDRLPYPYSLQPLGSPRTVDQAAIVMALRDVVAVSVMEDRLDPADAAALAGPGWRLLGIRDGPDDAVAGSEDAHGAPPHAPTSHVRVDEPSDADWAAAARDAARDAVAEADEPARGYVPPGTRVMRLAFFGSLAVLGIPAVMIAGFASDNLTMGLLGAGAVGALCWTFATWHPRR